MSFKRHWEIYPNERGADQKADALIAHSDEFPSWLFLEGLSPALPLSASPAGVEHAAEPAQLWAFMNTIALKMKTV